MAVTPLDIVIMQRNATGNKFQETIVPDNPNGFLGYNGSNLPVIRTIATNDISDSQVNYAKIQNISATNRFLGRITGGSGPVEELTPDNTITIINAASTNTLDFERLGNVAQYRILGSITAGTNPVGVLTPDNLITLLNQGTTTINGAIAPGTGTGTIANNTILGNTSDITAIATEQTPNNVIAILQGASNALTLTQIPSITYAKIQNISGENRILGRLTTGAGVTEELTPNNIVTILNTGSTALNSTIAPGAINAGNFTAMSRTAALGTVTTTQTIDVTATTTPLRLLVTATLSSANVIFNFTNLTSGLAGMEIILTITNGGTSRLVSIQQAGSNTNTTSGIYGFIQPTNIPSDSTGTTIFGMVWDGSKLHVNNLNIQLLLN
jgi:hypothetical protein